MIFEVSKWIYGKYTLTHKDGVCNNHVYDQYKIWSYFWINLISKRKNSSFDDIIHAASVDFSQFDISNHVTITIYAFPFSFLRFYSLLSATYGCFIGLFTVPSYNTIRYDTIQYCKYCKYKPTLIPGVWSILEHLDTNSWMHCIVDICICFLR